MHRLLLLILTLATLHCCSSRSEAFDTVQKGQAVPTILFSDLLSGPATGGEGGNGTIVSMYGYGFGDQRRSSVVTIDGVEASAYLLWSTNKIAIQIGARAHSGPICIQMSNNVISNCIPFVVREGRIRFASPTGDDRADGTYDRPWRSVIVAKNHLLPGDVLYLMDGLTTEGLDKYDSALSVQTSGTKDKPIAIVAYPSATVTIGSVTGPQIAMRTPNIDRSSDHWVIAGVRFLGAQEAIDVTASSDWRLVGNDISCPKGFGPTGCVEFGQSSEVALLGNYIHDVAQPGTTKQYHAVYFTTDSNHVDLGWNTIARVRACRGLQFHSSPLDPGTGQNQYDLRIHDNRIHDVTCDGINLATIDPSKGPVEIYNNVIYNVGTGPDPEDGSADYACIYIQGGANAGKPGSGIVMVHNNTLANCGRRGNTDSGALSLTAGSPEQVVYLRANVIVLAKGIGLLSPNSDKVALRTEQNICWPREQCPQGLGPTGWTIRESLFEDPAKGDYNVRVSGLSSDAKPAQQVMSRQSSANHGLLEAGATQYFRYWKGDQ